MHNGIPLTHPLRLFSRPPHFKPFVEKDAGEDGRPKMASRCVILPYSSLERREVAKAVLTAPEENAMHLVSMRFVSLDEETLAKGGKKLPTLGVLAPGNYLVIMVRGPRLLMRWSAVCGPSDPSLARLTDPDSIRARYGKGAGRDLKSKLFSDMSMMEGVGSKETSFFFGGRISDGGGSVGGKVEVNTISSMSGEGGGIGGAWPSKSKGTTTKVEVSARSETRGMGCEE